MPRVRGRDTRPPAGRSGLEAAGPHTEGLAPSRGGKMHALRIEHQIRDFDAGRRPSRAILSADSGRVCAATGSSDPATIRTTS